MLYYKNPRNNTVTV